MRTLIDLGFAIAIVEVQPGAKRVLFTLFTPSTDELVAESAAAELSADDLSRLIYELKKAHAKINPVASVPSEAKPSVRQES